MMIFQHRYDWYHYSYTSRIQTAVRPVPRVWYDSKLNALGAVNPPALGLFYPRGAVSKGGLS